MTLKKPGLKIADDARAVFPPERENEDAPLLTCQIQLGVKNKAHFLESTSVSVHRRRVAHVKHSEYVLEKRRASGGEGKNVERSARTKVKAADGRPKEKVGGVLMIHFNKKSSSALSKV